MKILTLASRNLIRNWRRTLVTTLAMAFACAIVILYGGLMEGMVTGFERQAVEISQGDIQIHAQGYRDNPDIYTTMADSEELLERLREHGFPATGRRYGAGLVVSEGNSSGVQLIGIDLVHEPEVTKIHRHVLSGEWLDGDDHLGVVIGKKLARLLDVEVGGELVYLGQTADGYMANEILTVRGILKVVSAAIDSSGVFLPKETLISVLELPEGDHEIVTMRFDRQVDLEGFKQQIQTLAPGHETLHWRDLLPVIAQFLGTVDVQTLFMMLFTYIAVASVVLNAILMSVFERLHEFGIMKAIGVSPMQSVVLIYTESLLQTTLAGLLGLGFGWWMTDYVQTHGLDMSAVSGEVSFGSLAFDPIWYAQVTPEILITPVCYLFVLAILAALYPAIKVAKIQAVDAIHYQ